ncbi:hypothetical protein VF21_03021 [Pseudogymnoascus sp. 05NY08]|nr:hypothetical protein VF21_03021 [Pseudogymnoascus sp. 05NY08]
MYFLNQKIDFSNRQKASSWLTRFKELDLRLVHWRTLLPAKWKDPEVPRPEATAALDPNMTLAHMTHNTSMILLHQRIGYPEPQLKAIKLPNFNSAKTCQSAAIETANIAMKYLAHAPESMLLSPHFSFCGYVSARALLVHCQYYGLALDPKFLILVKCLQEASRRWLCSQERSSTPSLSAQLADHLQFLHKRCLEDPTFYLRVVGSIESDVSRVAGDQSGDDMQRSQNRCEANHPPEQFLSAIATAGLATSLQLGQPSTSISVEMPLGVPSRNILSDENPEHWTPSPDVLESRGSKSSTEPQDELSNILQTLTDQSYAVTDRVISLDDFNFDAMSNDLEQIPPALANSDWTPDIYGYVAREHQHFEYHKIVPISGHGPTNRQGRHICMHVASLVHCYTAQRVNGSTAAPLVQGAGKRRARHMPLYATWSSILQAVLICTNLWLVTTEMRHRTLATDAAKQD